MVNSEDREVVKAVAQLVERARLVDPSYASGYGGTRSAARLLAESRTLFVERKLEGSARAMVMPFSAPEYDCVLAVDPRRGPLETYFEIRHEIAHIMRGEASEIVFLAHEDVMSHSERIADVFALADITPTSTLREWRRGRRPWRTVRGGIEEILSDMALGWGPLRIADRARIRLGLYRMRGI